MRLDQSLMERGICASRSRAADMIAQGHVQVNGKPARKASQKVNPDDVIETSGAEHSWVSRGGMKLAHALEQWPIDVQDAIALDVGASTGGFTHVLLHHGAAKIYAVDVGHDQLHETLCNDPRVVNMQGVNARDLALEEPVDIMVCDASFISLKLVLAKALHSAKQAAHLLALIKPQFEVGKAALPADGVVKDEAARQAVCDDIAQWVQGQGWHVKAITESPILGPKGNKEFLLWARLE